jgi:hypothetical protein
MNTTQRDGIMQRWNIIQYELDLGLKAVATCSTGEVMDRRYLTDEFASQLGIESKFTVQLHTTLVIPKHKVSWRSSLRRRCEPRSGVAIQPYKKAFSNN